MKQLFTAAITAFSFSLFLTSNLLAQADLSISSATISDAAPAQGAPLKLSATYNNLGDQKAERTWLGVYVSSTSNFSEAEWIGSYNSGPEVAPNANAQVAIEDFSMGFEYAPGTYYLFVRADENEKLSEKDIINNISEPIMVSLQSADVDLSVDGLEVSSTSVNAGETINVGFNVKNFGTTSLAYPSQRIYVVSDTTTTSSVLASDLYSFAFEAIEAGGELNFNKNINLDLLPGTYYVYAATDYSNGVPENEERNNTSNYVAITVRGHTPNFN